MWKRLLSPKSILPIFCIVIQLLSRVWLFATSWTAAPHTPLSFITFQSSLKFMSIELVMLSNHLIFRHPFLLLPSIFPSIKVFPNDLALRIRWPITGAPASAIVLPMNTQGWFPLGLTGLISLQSVRTSAAWPFHSKLLPILQYMLFASCLLLLYLAVWDRMWG